MDMDERDFARNLMTTLAGEDLPLEDESFDEEMMDNLMFNPFADVTGLIALFYRNMWAMADLREKLKRYEDAEEQGRVLPCTVGDVVYIITKQNISKQRIQKIEIDSFGCVFSTKHRKFSLSYFGNNVFLNREEAEAKLKEMEGSHAENRSV